MNAIAFGTKRAFHGFLRLTRKPLVSMGLTAARFDMLSAVLMASNPYAHLRQSDLRKTLGVTAPVVTRMLQALEKRGWVRRTREARGDRRQRIVSLTYAGKWAIVGARRSLMRAVQRLVYVAICFGRHRDSACRLLHMDTLEGYLRALRREFGDTASLYYPWGHPDD